MEKTCERCMTTSKSHQDRILLRVLPCAVLCNIQLQSPAQQTSAPVVHQLRSSTLTCRQSEQGHRRGHILGRRMRMRALCGAHVRSRAYLAGHLDRVHGDEPGLIAWQRKQDRRRPTALPNHACYQSVGHRAGIGKHFVSQNCASSRADGCNRRCLVAYARGRWYVLCSLLCCTLTAHTALTCLSRCAWLEPDRSRGQARNLWRPPSEELASAERSLRAASSMVSASAGRHTWQHSAGQQVAAAATEHLQSQGNASCCCN